MLTVPAWDAPQGVRAIVSGRWGGCSSGKHAEFNLGLDCGDDASSVMRNRRLLADRTDGVSFCWLRQQHGTKAVRFESAEADAAAPAGDIAYASRRRLACTVLTADCVPLLLAASDGSIVAAVHAGWHGLAAGIAERAAGLLPGEFAAYVGPHIGQCCYRIGDDVKNRLAASEADEDCFVPTGDGGWRADLGKLALGRLQRTGRCAAAASAGVCTSCSSNLYSARRDGPATGRFACAVWLE